MDTAQRNLSIQVQFWALIGPFIALVTLMVIFVKASPLAFYLSFATILGMLVSWKWKEIGFLLSCSTVLGLYLYQYSTITPEEHLWHVGISFAIAIGFGITALGYQEVDALLEEDEEAGEDLQILRSAVAKGEEALRLVQEDIAAKQHQIESYGQVVDAARQEVAKVCIQHQKLVKDFLDKQLECAQLQERLSESCKLEETLARCEEEIVNLKQELQDREHDFARAEEEMANRLHMENLEYEQIVHEANERARTYLHDKEKIEALVMAKDQELAQKQLQIQGGEIALQETRQIKERELSEKQSLIQSLEIRHEEARKSAERELSEKQSLIQSLEIRHEEVRKSAERELSEKQSLIQSLEIRHEEVRKSAERDLSEKQSLIQQLALQASQPQITVAEVNFSEMRRLEGLHKQLKQQFDEKSATLDAARKELFSTQEKLFCLQRSSDEIQTYGIDEAVEGMHTYLKQVVKESESSISRLEAEVAHLEDVVHSFIHSR